MVVGGKGGWAAEVDVEVGVISSGSEGMALLGQALTKEDGATEKNWVVESLLILMLFICCSWALVPALDVVHDLVPLSDSSWTIAFAVAVAVAVEVDVEGGWI